MTRRIDDGSPRGTPIILAIVAMLMLSVITGVATYFYRHHQSVLQSMEVVHHSRAAGRELMPPLPALALQQDDNQPIIDSHANLDAIALVVIFLTVIVVFYVLLALLFEVRVGRRAQIRLRQASSGLASMLEAHPLPVIARDRDGNVLLRNREADRQLSRTKQDPAEREWDSESLESIGRLRQYRRQALDGIETSNAEIIVRRPDGSTFEAVASVSPYRGEGGEIEGTVTVYGDISELKKSERERLAVLRDERDFIIQEVNHTVKNNLQGIANLIHLQLTPRAELNGVLQKVIAQLRAVAAMHGLRSKTCESLSFEKLVAEIVKNVSLSFTADIDFVSRLNSRSTFVEATETVPITLIITELLINALKHGRGRPSSDDNSYPVIALSSSGADIVVEVSNLGSLPNERMQMDGVELGDGLRLCQALLPRDQANIRLESKNGTVVAVLVLHPPVVTSIALEEHVA